MTTIIVSVLVGLVVGWNLPQPEWAKTLQDKIVTKIKNLRK